MNFTLKQIKEIRSYVTIAVTRSSGQAEKVAANRKIVEYYNMFARVKYSYDKAACKTCTMNTIVATVNKKIHLDERELEAKKKRQTAKREDKVSKTKKKSGKEDKS